MARALRSACQALLKAIVGEERGNTARGQRRHSESARFAEAEREIEETEEEKEDGQEEKDKKKNKNTSSRDNRGPLRSQI